MPIVLPKDLPARAILKSENIFTMTKARAQKQDIRPIEIAIVNLMPTKIETETQLMRLLSNSPLQVNITLLRTATYQSKNTPKKYLEKFYKDFSDIKREKFDGMIITGAPVENMPFEEVAYWEELTKIFDYSDEHVTSTINICWGAQAALYYFYNIKKIKTKEKIFGVFKNWKTSEYEPLLKGIDDFFYIPMSRHTSVDEDAVRAEKKLQILTEGEKGLSILKSKNNKRFFFIGHSEYDRETLKNEYLRDINKGLKIEKPENYFVGDSTNKINMSWGSTANLLFYNWLNYYVYQVTPYEIKKI